MGSGPNVGFVTGSKGPGFFIWHMPLLQTMPLMQSESVWQVAPPSLKFEASSKLEVFRIDPNEVPLMVSFDGGKDVITKVETCAVRIARKRFKINILLGKKERI